MARERFDNDDFAEIQDGKLKLKHDDKVALPTSVTTLQKVIDARLPSIRIEQLLMEVDQLTHFSRHFTPVQGHSARPPHFYRTLMATLISQATNLGVVSMSASVQGTTVDMLRHVIQDFVREETLTAASAELVNRHHALPLSAIHGTGTISSSDAQRFGIRASSLLASYYPRYSAVVICHARASMVPSIQAEYANQDKGGCDGIADCRTCSRGHRPHRGFPRPV